MRRAGFVIVGFFLLKDELNGSMFLHTAVGQRPSICSCEAIIANHCLLATAFSASELYNSPALLVVLSQSLFFVLHVFVLRQGKGCVRGTVHAVIE